MRRGFSLLVLVVACGDDDGRGGASNTTPTATSPVTSASTTNNPMTESGSDTEDTGTPTASDTEDDDASGPTTLTSTSTSPTAESGDTNPPDGVDCRYECTAPADCIVGETDFGYTCQNGKCAIACGTDDACIAFFSGWLIEPCGASSECEFNACVSFDGIGGCAFTPELGSCADLGLVDTERMSIEGTPITVCAEPNAVCVDLDAGMECIVPCADFVECYEDGSGELCTSQGECVYACASAADCPASNFVNVTAVCD